MDEILQIASTLSQVCTKDARVRSANSPPSTADDVTARQAPRIEQSCSSFPLLALARQSAARAKASRRFALRGPSRQPTGNIPCITFVKGHRHRSSSSIAIRRVSNQVTAPASMYKQTTNAGPPSPVAQRRFAATPHYRAVPTIRATQQGTTPPFPSRNRRSSHLKHAPTPRRIKLP